MVGAGVFHEPAEHLDARRLGPATPADGARPWIASLDDQGRDPGFPARPGGAGRECAPGLMCTEQVSTDAVAIVTGGSWGAGREIARMLASLGYAVVVVYLRDQSKAEATVDEILAANGTALAVRADTTDAFDVERLFDETKAAFQGVDVIVHGAGCGTSVVNRHAARELRHGGAIINVSGSGAVTPVSPGSCARAPSRSTASHLVWCRRGPATTWAK